MGISKTVHFKFWDAFIFDIKTLNGELMRAGVLRKDYSDAPRALTLDDIQKDIRAISERVYQRSLK